MTTAELQSEHGVLLSVRPCATIQATPRTEASRLGTLTARPLVPLVVQRDRCPRAPLPPRGLCSHLSEGPHGEGLPYPTHSPTPALCPCRPWLLSDRVGGGSHQTASPGWPWVSPACRVTLRARRVCRKQVVGGDRPAPSPAPEARHRAPTRKVAAKRRVRTAGAEHARTVADTSQLRDCQVRGRRPRQSARGPASSELPGAGVSARSDLPGDQRGRGPQEMSAGPGHTEGTSGLSSAARPQEIWGVSWPLRDHRSS